MDARRALTALEVAVLSQAAPPTRGDATFVGDDARKAAPPTTPEGVKSMKGMKGTPPGGVVVDLQTAADSIQRKAIQYDATGDTHYDAISAMIKSIRGSDPDAAVYWIARMIEAGEDPRFIARRIVIAAAEDVGNADPRGLVLAQAAADATQFIGLPECRIPLAQAAIYLACAPKSNASAVAIWTACEDVRNGRTLPVPRHLRSTGYRGAEILGSGKGYQYPHDAPEGIVQQDYLGVDKTYYTPTDRGAEARIREYLEKVRGGPAEPEEP
jgi:putative ATPase